MGDMDSGNSGSLQSSSTGGGGGGVGGGDEQEFESHGGEGETSSFPASFFNNPTVNYQVAPMDNATLLQLYSLNNNNNGSSSSLNNMFDHHQQHGQVHFGSLDSANFNTGKFIAHESNNLDSIMWGNKFGPISTHGYNNNNLQPPQLGPGPPPLSENSTRSSNLNAGGGSGGPCRNPKKRSRASRRAPTTVLTTDTSNFRQMVQEFTGIPAPPFSSFPTRSRLDLFSGMGTGMGSGLGLGPSSYLLRPFAQKIAPPNNVPMLSFQSLLQQSSSLIQDGSKGSGSVPDNWGGLHQGLGLTQVNEVVGNLGVAAATDAAANNAERVDVINSSSTSENHGGGGGMVADSWICSSD